MKDLRVDHLHKTYGEKTILEDVSFLINEGDRVGLIGKNGTGKTTLLDILSGVDFPEGGTMKASNDYRIGYLRQNPLLDDDKSVFDVLYQGDHPTLATVRNYEQIVLQLSQNPTDATLMKRFEALEEEMNQIDGWQFEVKIKSILNKVGIIDITKRVGDLSGGQKRRVALAKVLIDEPDLLLLDEPTNHLDMEAIQWLETYLANYKGSLLLVTHDRYFLERVVNHMFELVHGRIEAYEGNYQTYLEERAAREAIQSKMDHKQERLYQQELHWMRQGAKARTTKQQARIQRFETLEKDVKNKTTEQELEITVDQKRIGKRVFQLEDIDLSIAGHQVLKDFELIIQSNARIGIIGQNGIGKSTLLHTLAGLYHFDKGTFITGETVHIAYYKQNDIDIPMDKQVVQYLREYAEEVRQKNGEVASISELLETFLFPRHMHGAYISTLSGGERRRLYLLKLLMTKPNVLLLDEPTNDLDIDTLTVLEKFISEFNGAVITVSHDRYFLDKTSDILLEIKGQGAWDLFYGSMSEYLDEQKILKEQMMEEAKELKKVEEVAIEAVKVEKKRRLTYHEQKEWDTLEDDIAAIEEKISTIEEEMQTVGSDFAKLQELQEALDAASLNLEEKYNRWEELAPIAND
ncbi:ATP-binding cassette, subfamily F, uup [Granulicatella balaenopterae]|uniref:ATP-binding cassette, subfamily F, uup n=1 Tax=Granulicatella balaenopterae TaxID=137733 RepID=A0A1H9K2T5_9LACT|nr:ABC-F family ATP-binding cassette domain-containing protein [Granulicatella balaenopterae]SEQ93287.1 ATP-binding cassette, subfamily F, uup [Granulicatella balaenopterae]